MFGLEKTVFHTRHFYANLCPTNAINNNLLFLMSI